MHGLRKKGRYWYLRARRDGVDTEVATGCTDHKAAEAFARRYQLDAADPDSARRKEATATTMQEAVDLQHTRHIAEAKAGKLTDDTVEFYLHKFGQLLRVLGPDALLASVDASRVDALIAQRRSEEATDHTIHKELHALRTVMANAKRAGLWFGDLDAVFPRFGTGYQPKARSLSVDEVRRVIAVLPPDRGAWVALAAGAGAELAALESARRDDLDLARGFVRVRGSKNARRDREVPLTLPDCRELVELAFAKGGGKGPLLLRPWGKNWRDPESPPQNPLTARRRSHG